LTFKRVEEKK
jgi:elongation factor 1-gamma